MRRFLLLCCFVCFAGCHSVPDVPYYLISEYDGAALIYFDSGLQPLAFDDIEFPPPDKGKRFNPLAVPADESFSLLLTFDGNSVSINIPPLEAGKDYRLLPADGGGLELRDAEEGTVCAVY